MVENLVFLIEAIGQQGLVPWIPKRKNLQRIATSNSQSKIPLFHPSHPNNPMISPFDHSSRSCLPRRLQHFLLCCAMPRLPLRCRGPVGPRYGFHQKIHRDSINESWIWISFENMVIFPKSHGLIKLLSKYWHGFRGFNEQELEDMICINIIQLRYHQWYLRVFLSWRNKHGSHGNMNFQGIPFCDVGKARRHSTKVTSVLHPILRLKHSRRLFGSSKNRGESQNFGVHHHFPIIFLVFWPWPPWFLETSP